MKVLSRTETDAGGEPKVYNSWVGPHPISGMRCEGRNLPMLKQEEYVFARMLAEGVWRMEIDSSIYVIEEIMDPDPERTKALHEAIAGWIS